jgi:hypothetical protein
MARCPGEQMLGVDPASLLDMSPPRGTTWAQDLVPQTDLRAIYKPPPQRTLMSSTQHAQTHPHNNLPTNHPTNQSIHHNGSLVRPLGLARSTMMASGLLLTNDSDCSTCSCSGDCSSCGCGSCSVSLPMCFEEVWCWDDG